MIRHWMKVIMTVTIQQFWKRYWKEIDKVTYQWISTTNSTGHLNGTNVKQSIPGPQKQARNKLTPLDIWKQFFTNEIIVDILLYKNNKISNIISYLLDEILENNKYSYINIITKSELLTSGFMYARQLFGETLLKAKKTFLQWDRSSDI